MAPGSANTAGKASLKCILSQSWQELSPKPEFPEHMVLAPATPSPLGMGSQLSTSLPATAFRAPLTPPGPQWWSEPHRGVRARYALWCVRTQEWWWTRDSVEVSCLLRSSWQVCPRDQPAVLAWDSSPGSFADGSPLLWKMPQLFMVPWDSRVTE